VSGTGEVLAQVCGHGEPPVETPIGRGRRAGGRPTRKYAHEGRAARRRRVISVGNPNRWLRWSRSLK